MHPAAGGGTINTNKRPAGQSTRKPARGEEKDPPEKNIRKNRGSNIKGGEKGTAARRQKEIVMETNVQCVNTLTENASEKIPPCVLKQTLPLYPCFCGADKCLSLQGAFSLVLAGAAMHCELIGTGCEDMKAAHRFWLMMRTKIRFFGYPDMMETVRLTTWPAVPGHYTCDRYYTLEREDGSLMVEARNEWAVLDSDSGRPIRTEQIYDPALTFLPGGVLTEPFLRQRDTLTEEDFAARYRVQPSDIDFGNHMNHTVYPRIIADSFSVGEQKEMRIEEIEVQYLTPCYEGEELTVLRRREANTLLFSIRNAEGKTAFLATVRVAE